MKRLSTLFGLAVAATALVTSTYASPVTAQPGDAPRTPYVIPFKLKDNLIKVQATINGEKVTAVLDSGTGGLILSKALAVKRGLQLNPDSSVQAAGGGTGKQTISPVKLHATRFGTIDIHDVSRYAIDMHTLSTSSGFKIDALLGYPFFKNHAIRINYPQRTISIYPTGDAPHCANPIPIEIVHHVPVITAKISAQPGAKTKTYHLIVDLGSRHHSYLGEKFLKTKTGKTLFAQGHLQRIGDGTAGVMEGVVTELAKLDVGTQHFRDVNFALTKDVKAFNLQE